MVVWALVAASGSCTPVSLRPRGAEHTGAYRGLYSARFEVACDSCFVTYGPQGGTRGRVVEGGWSGDVPLGAVRTGQKVYLILRADPYGRTRVQSGRIEVDGETVASGKGKKEGQGVYLSTHVGPG